MVVGPVGVGVVSLSSFARGEAIGGYPWYFIPVGSILLRMYYRYICLIDLCYVFVSLVCLATRSVESCVGLPRLYETVVQEGQGGGWEGDVGGWTGRLPAGGWELGSKMGFFVSQEGHTRRITLI
jgi:hypothetical protein